MQQWKECSILNRFPSLDLGIFLSMADQVQILDVDPDGDDGGRRDVLRRHHCDVAVFAACEQIALPVTGNSAVFTLGSIQTDGSQSAGSGWVIVNRTLLSSA
jgi:hypothetical protein